MTNKLYGRDFEHWAEVDSVMKKHSITTAKSLDAKLSKKPAKPVNPMDGRVLIVDSKNTDRVLGSIPRPAGASPRLDCGDCYNVAVMGRINLATLYDPMFDTVSPSVSHVRFGFRVVDRTVVLTTSAPLDLLAQIRDFRFPGESEEQAHVRQMYS